MDTKNLVEYLILVSNKNLLLSFGMHLMVLISIISIFLLKDVRIRKYVVEGMILALFLSVTINAITFGNPFHAITFGIMTVISGFVLVKGKNKIEMPKKEIRTVISFVFILLGLWYPELVNANAFKSFLVSPVGIVPCPTLITVLGMLSLFYPDINKKQFWVTVFFGIVYGIIGTFKLGVYFDLCLIGAVVFAICNVITDTVVQRKKTLKV